MRPKSPQSPTSEDLKKLSSKQVLQAQPLEHGVRPLKPSLLLLVLHLGLLLVPTLTWNSLLSSNNGLPGNYQNQYF